MKNPLKSIVDAILIFLGIKEKPAATPKPVEMPEVQPAPEPAPDPVIIPTEPPIVVEPPQVDTVVDVEPVEEIPEPVAEEPVTPDPVIEVEPVPEPVEEPKPEPVIVPLPTPEPVKPPVVTPKPEPLPPAAERTGRDLPFNFGAAVKDPVYKNPKQAELVNNHFRQLTPEYQSQMTVVHPDANSWNFKEVDKLMLWCKENKHDVHLHSVEWPMKLKPYWSALPKTKDAFNKQLKSDIYTYVNHFKQFGVATSIDVWNEFFAEGKVGVPKPNIIIDNMGMDGFYRAFHYVKEADPTLKTFLNDYGQEFGGNKVKGMLAMIDECKKRNVPLDGIGFQMHLTLPMLKKDKLKIMKESVLKFADKGMFIHFSEHDVKLFKDINGKNIRNAQGKVDLTKELLEQQAELSYETKEIFLSVPAELQWGLKTWGVDDETHNENLNASVNNDHPVFFDNNLDPKPVFRRFLEN